MWLIMVVIALQSIQPKKYLAKPISPIRRDRAKTKCLLDESLAISS